MEDEKQLKTIEEELKLLKGELKASLASVRDYLLNMELPTTEFSTIMAALGDTGEHSMELKGTFQLPPDNQAKEEPEPEPEPVPEDKEEEEEEEEEEVVEIDDKKESPKGSHAKNHGESEMILEEEEEPPKDEEMIPDEPEAEIEEEPDMAEDIFDDKEPFMPDTEIPIEEPLMDYPISNNGLGQSVPKVNLLANLISWISLARREIGDDQLPTFLEIYGISGYLSPEMKEVILHLANITSEKPGENNMAEIWSNSMLSLHGILTGGDVPLNPVKPQWGELDEGDIEPPEEETEETEVPEEQPVKLKLVFPNGDGKGKEYCIDLTPEANNDEPEL